jgi:hypothetical protein
MINVKQANGKYPNGLQSVIATFVLQPSAAMGLLPLLLLLVVSSALATPVNIYDVNYDPMLGTNFANDFRQNYLSLGLHLRAAPRQQYRPLRVHQHRRPGRNSCLNCCMPWCMPVLTLLSPGRVYEGRRLREPGRQAGGLLRRHRGAPWRAPVGPRRPRSASWTFPLVTPLPPRATSAACSRPPAAAGSASPWSTSSRPTSPTPGWTRSPATSSRHREQLRQCAGGLGATSRFLSLIPSFQDRRSGQDVWSAELAAALALFAEDTGSLVRLGRHDDFDKDYRSTNPRYICLLGAHIHEIHPHHFPLNH